MKGVMFNDIAVTPIFYSTMCVVSADQHESNVFWNRCSFFQFVPFIYSYVIFCAIKVRLRNVHAKVINKHIHIGTACTLYTRIEAAKCDW